MRCDEREGYVYQIGLFSQINHVTTRTLRHYDEIGLLKPGHVDAMTGYRYYTSDQLTRINQILSLRQLGISLQDIREILDRPDTLDMILRIKERELAESIREQQSRLQQIRTYLQKTQGETFMKYHTVIKSLPGGIVASMRREVASYDTYFDVVPKMGDEMRRQGAVCAEPEYCFTIYHDGEYRDRDIDVEVCEAVIDFCPDSEMVKYKRIPPVKEAACVLHKGPYATIREAYQHLFAWIEDNGYEIADNPRESYIDGIWNKEDEADWLTELQVPVKKR